MADIGEKTHCQLSTQKKTAEQNFSDVLCSPVLQALFQIITHTAFLRAMAENGSYAHKQ